MKNLWHKFWNMSHRDKAWWIVALALTTDACMGWLFSWAQHIPVWHGLYVALADAVTFGGDLSPSTPVGYIACTVICVMVIPLFGAALSLITTWLTSGSVKAHVETAVENQTADIKSHVEDQLAAQTTTMKAHFDSAK